MHENDSLTDRQRAEIAKIVASITHSDDAFLAPDSLAEDFIEFLREKGFFPGCDRNAITSQTTGKAESRITISETEAPLADLVKEFARRKIVGRISNGNG